MNKSIHDSDYKLLISLLRSKRESLKITQEHLAELLAVKQTVVSKIETCERRIDVIELRRICTALKISFVDFISEFEIILNHD